MLQRTIGILLIVVVLGVAAHDAWRFTIAYGHLRDTTHELARWAGENAIDLDRDSAAAAVARRGTEAAVFVYRYEQTDQRVQVWTRAEVPDTLVAGLVANLISGKSFDEARRAPFFISDYREAGFQ